jgi:uncharacterized protein
MPVKINLRHLEEHSVKLDGELPVADLELDIHDEMLQARKPLQYEAEVERVEQSLILKGRLRLVLDCQCVRCLDPFQFDMEIDPWEAYVPLEGEEAAPIVNDCVDLTPYIREDILLEFPRHPLCDPGCQGLQSKAPGKKKKKAGSAKTDGSSSAWSVLNKLKF